MQQEDKVGSVAGPVQVIIVNFNTPIITRNSILSAIQADVPENRIILVDNASTDGSLDMLKSQFPMVEFIENESNMGFGYANNQGMTIAQGDWFFLLNSDAELQPGVLEELLKVGVSTPNIAMVGPRVKYPDGRVQYTAGPSPTLLRYLLRVTAFLVPQFVRTFYRANRVKLAQHEAKVIDVESISAVALLVNRKFFEESGGFDENFFMYVEDVDWSLRARKSGWKIKYVPSVSIFHLDGGSSGARYRKFKPVALQSMLYFFKKHKGFLGYWVFRMLGVAVNVLKVVLGGFAYLLTLGNQQALEITRIAWQSLNVFLRPLKSKKVSET